MHVARSRTVRNKSCSPVPPTPTQSNPRPFLPPSHYAAAASFNSRSPISPNANHIGESSKHRRDEDRKRKHSKNLPEPSSSDSSIISATEEPLQKSNAQNIRSGLPDLEAHLLPSLRDTIDRMTLTPSRNSTHYKPSEIPTAKRHNRNQSRKNSPEFQPGRSLRPSETKHINSRDFPAMNDESNQSTPKMGTSSRLKAGPKPALKFSLRSPTPSPSSPKPRQAIANSPSTAGSSLKNMRSLLSRKCSGTLKSPFSNSKTHKEVKEVGSQDVLQAEFDSDQPLLVDSPRKIFHSNIPRPQARYYKEDPTGLDDSDLDRRYDATLRDRRKLTVANAAVSISGSSSESDADPGNSHCAKNTSRNWKQEERSHGPVGLGLSMPYTSTTRRNDGRYWESSNSQQEEFRPSFQEKMLRFSLPASESAGSNYSDDFNLPRSNFSSGNDRRTFRQSQDIVGNPSISAQVNTYNGAANQLKGRFRNSYSRSPPFSYSTKEESTDDETESEREGYSFRRSKINDSRWRSSSCEPRFTSSPKLSDDSAIPIVPPRSRSVCQSRAPSPRTSRIFPDNLRELIKSRNSFSKPPPPIRKEPPPPVPVAPSRHPSADNGRREEYHKSQKRPAGHSYTPSTPRSRREEETPQQQYRQEQSEASAIAYGYRSAVARERLAFGIPPSESDEIIATAEDEQLSHADSDMSSLNQTMWQVDSEDLSVDAESIFKALDYSKSKERKKQQLMFENTPRLSIISPTLSASSTYDPGALQNPSSRTNRQREDPPTDLDPSSSKDPPKSREGVIQEIFETEEDLLRLFHICMDIFILPLRIQESRSWIEGVPPNVAKLLDWFNDIVNLHEQIYQSLCSARDTMSPATDRVSESLRSFVMKVEVYQPYLVRLADVSTEIATHLDNLGTDFGQFVAIQQRSPECEGWSLERLLMLPVNRLAAYQDLFARMLDLTPKTHQDYLSTFSLSRSTDMVVRVMTEVKIREDEYNLLKEFSLRIQGLSSPSDLATRERRLLHSGPLALVIPDSTAVDAKLRSRQRPGDASCSDRGSRLLDAIGPSSSMVFDSRFNTVKSTSTDNSFSSGGPITSTPVKSSWFSRLPLRKRSKSPLPSAQPMANCKELPTTTTLHTVSVHAFVFNDLVLLAQPSQTSGEEPHWVLSRDLGIFRPLSIAGLETKAAEGIAVSLETMIADPEHLDAGIDFRISSLRTVDLVISPSLTGNSDDNNISDLCNDDGFQAWLMAFRRCSQTILRKLTFPGLPRQEDFFNGSDRMLDTRLAISSLLGSGLPIPRSPSGTFADMHGWGSAGSRGNEREERGWWSLRYQQIFREFQRQDSLLSDDDDSLAI